MKILSFENSSNYLKLILVMFMIVRTTVQNENTRCHATIPSYTLPKNPGCLFQPVFANYSYNVSLTWEQARNVCHSLNATLPIILSGEGTHRHQEKFITKRIWLGLIRNENRTKFMWYTKPNEHLNYTYWAKYEPNDSNCNEDCSYANYDGTWGDYNCNHLPEWDSCDDDILTLCHYSDREDCYFDKVKGKMKIKGDWYIILLLTFGGLVSVILVLGFLRFLLDQCVYFCNRRKKPLLDRIKEGHH